MGILPLRAVPQRQRPGILESAGTLGASSRKQTMKSTLRILGLMIGLLATGCDDSATGVDVTRPVVAMAAVDADRDDGEEKIPLDQVPANVKNAAQAALPGLVLEEAERETEDGTVLYSLQGLVDGQEYEVEVTAAGKVLEIEKEDDDEDDDNDDEDDD